VPGFCYELDKRLPGGSIQSDLVRLLFFFFFFLQWLTPLSAVIFCIYDGSAGSFRFDFVCSTVLAFLCALLFITYVQLCLLSFLPS